MQLQSVIDHLDQMEPSLDVRIRSIGDAPEEWNGTSPGTEVLSYRGDYSLPSIEPGCRRGEWDQREEWPAVTVRELANALRDSIGITITGYKGGDYTVRGHSPLHVAHWGDWSQCQIVAVVRSGDVCELVVAKTE